MLLFAKGIISFHLSVDIVFVSLLDDGILDLGQLIAEEWIKNFLICFSNQRVGVASAMQDVIL